MGILAVARVCEVTPNSLLQWLVEAAEHLHAFSRYFLRDVEVEQVQMDELFALLSAVKDGEITEAMAMQRLLALHSGDRTMAMAQRLIHQVTQVLTPDCAPLFLTDGFREYLTAFVTHYGQWVQQRYPTRPMILVALSVSGQGHDGLPFLVCTQSMSVLHRRDDAMH